ncbi:MAG: hypothetical protein ACYTHJ_01630 [Planctomycetota bacterium]
MPAWVFQFTSSLMANTSRDEEEYVRELRNVPDGWLGVAALALIVGLCWAVVWMYRREGRQGASPGMRTALAAIRCAVLVALAVILLEPVRVRILRRWIDSYAIVLVDDSSSMDLSDHYDDPQRSDTLAGMIGASSGEPLVRKKIAESVLLADDRAFLKALAGNNRVKVYSFSEEPTLLGTIKADREKATAENGDTDNGQNEQRADHVESLPISLEASGATTNLDRAVRRAVDSVGSSPLAGIVLITDGGINQGASVDEVSNFLAERRLPIHVIGVGDPAPPRNVRVINVDAPENAFKQDPFAITAEIGVQGLVGQTIQVQLRERRADSSEADALVNAREVLVEKDGALAPIVFQRQRAATGRFVYEINVPTVGAESVTDDNTKQTSVNVIEARTKVLVVSGSPSWEYRYLSRLLERDETFDVSCWLQSADLSAVRDGNTIIDHLPRMPEELFVYDVIILMDPSREEFGEPWCRLIDTWVTEHGGGVLVSAARAYSPDFLRDKSLTALHDLLPVTLDPEADLLLNRIGHYQLKAANIEVPDTALGHPVLRMADDPASNRLAWQDGNQVYWHFPVLREKPVATVLMRHGDPRMRNNHGAHVLAAVQYVGAGRSGFVGFDSTWRWRRLSPERFDRFWVQMVRFLAEGKLLGGARRGMLLTESDQYSLGEAVTVDARLFNARYEPISASEVTARVEVENARTELILRAREDRAGWFQGQFVPDRTGSYRISLEIPESKNTDETTVSKSVYVARPNIEIINPQMNRAALVSLAENSAGGRFLEVEEARNVPGEIRDLHEEVMIRSRPTSLWDNGTVLAILVGLLVVEWAVRKWCRLL